MKKILIFTAVQGHVSIAKAVKQILDKDYEVKITNPYDFKIFDFYTTLYRYFPNLVKFPYNLAKKDHIQKAVNKLMTNRLKEETIKVIKSFKPDLIISTYFLYNPVIEKINNFQTHPIPFINILANTWVLHPLEFSSKADLNWVYDSKALELGNKFGLKKEKLFAGGWFVRKQFYKNHEIEKINNQLGFDPKCFTALICGGSEGTSMILKILPSLLSMDKKMQLIIICGNNNELYKAANSFKNLLNKFKNLDIKHLKNINNRLKLKIFQFTNQMPQLINVSDIVVGKAGPNLLFETVACKKPFFAITHISGQEDGNLDIIKEKKLGYVQENPLKANKLIKNIIRNPQQLENFKKPLKKQKEYNQKAEMRLLKKVCTLINA